MPYPEATTSNAAWSRKPLAPFGCGGVGRPASFRLDDDGTASPYSPRLRIPAHGARNAAGGSLPTGC